MFTFEIQRNGEEATIHFIGNLSVKDSLSVKSELVQLRDLGVKRLIFDFEKLSYLDSSGIGILLHSYTWAKEKQGSIKIIHMPKEIRAIFQISNLMDVFQVE